MSTDETARDKVKECRDKCQPIRPKDNQRAKLSRQPAKFFWLSKDKTECNCLPRYPLGGNKYIYSFILINNIMQKEIF